MDAGNTISHVAIVLPRTMGDVNRVMKTTLARSDSCIVHNRSIARNNRIESAEGICYALRVALLPSKEKPATLSSIAVLLGPQREAMMRDKCPYTLIVLDKALPDPERLAITSARSEAGIPPATSPCSSFHSPIKNAGVESSESITSASSNRANVESRQRLELAMHNQSTHARNGLRIVQL